MEKKIKRTKKQSKTRPETQSKNIKEKLKTAVPDQQRNLLMPANKTVFLYQFIGKAINSVNF